MHNIVNDVTRPEEKFVLMLQLIAANEWRIVYHMVLGVNITDLSMTLEIPLQKKGQPQEVIIHESDFPFDQNVIESFACFKRICDRISGMDIKQLRLLWPSICDYIANKHLFVSDTLSAPFMQAGYAHPLGSKRGQWTDKGRELIKRRFPHLVDRLAAFTPKTDDYDAFCIASGALKSLHVFSPTQFRSAYDVVELILRFNTDIKASGWVSTIYASFYYDVSSTIINLRKCGKELYTKALKLILPRLDQKLALYDLSAGMNNLAIHLQEGLTVGGYYTYSDQMRFKRYINLLLKSHMLCRDVTDSNPIFWEEDEQHSLVINWILKQLSTQEPFYAHIMDTICCTLSNRCSDECFIAAFKILRPLMRICTQKLDETRTLYQIDHLMHEKVTIDVIKVLPWLEPEITLMEDPLKAQSLIDIGLPYCCSFKAYLTELLAVTYQMKYQSSQEYFYMILWHVYMREEPSECRKLVMKICNHLFYLGGYGDIDKVLMDSLYPNWENFWIAQYQMTCEFDSPDYEEWCKKQFDHLCSKNFNQLDNSKKKRKYYF